MERSFQLCVHVLSPKLLKRDSDEIWYWRSAPEDTSEFDFNSCCFIIILALHEVQNWLMVKRRKGF
jgi:hypothetical protein